MVQLRVLGYGARDAGSIDTHCSPTIPEGDPTYLPQCIEMRWGVAQGIVRYLLVLHGWVQRRVML